MAIKRLHYFDHQFLVEADFTDEQTYHLDARRRHTKLLHGFGIGDRLQVLKTGNRQVTVKAGGAVDKDGREMVLEADKVLDLSNTTDFPGGSTVSVTIAYEEKQTDVTTAAGLTGNTRWTEDPKVEAKAAPPAPAPPTDGTVVVLAQFKLSPDVPGADGAELDGGVRRSARLAPGSVAESNLAPALLAKVNTPQGLTSVDLVSNPGGNVDLVPTGGITIVPDNVGKTITFGHTITAASLGALLTSNYALGQRKLAEFKFTQTDGPPTASRTTVLGFSPQLILAFSSCRLFLGGQEFTGGSVGFFDTLANQQRCLNFAADRLANADPNTVSWFPRPPIIVPAPPPPPAPQPPPPPGVGSFTLVDRTAAVRGEQLTLTVTPTANGVTLTLTRTTTIAPPGTVLGPPQTFDLFVNLFCMGAS